MPSIKSVNLPYKGVVSSSELSSYFNSILHDIEGLENRLVQIETKLQHGYVYGCMLEYDSVNRTLTVNDGFYTWNNDLRFIRRTQVQLDLEDGDVVYIDPQAVATVIEAGKTVPENCIPLGQYVNQAFSYKIRNQFIMVDEYAHETRMLASDLPITQFGKHLDIQYALRHLNMQMYSQSDGMWHYVARVMFVKSERFAMTTPVPVEGIVLYEQDFVFGQFQPMSVVLAYRSLDDVTNVSIQASLDGTAVGSVELGKTQAQNVVLRLPTDTYGFRRLTVRFVRTDGQVLGVLPQQFAYSLYVSF